MCREMKTVASLSGSPIQPIGLGLAGIDRDVTTNNISFYIQEVNRNSALFTIKISGNQGSTVTSLTYTYMAVDPSFNSGFVLTRYSNNDIEDDPVDQSFSISVASNGITLAGGQEVILAYLSEIFFQAISAADKFEFLVFTNIMSDDDFQIRIMSTGMLKIHSFAVYIVIFDKQELQEDYHQKIIFSYDRPIKDSNVLSVSLTPFANPIYSRNCFIGLNSIRFSNLTHIDFTDSLNNALYNENSNQTTVSFSSTQITFAFADHYLIFWEYKCLDVNYPFYYYNKTLVERQCHAQCPVGSYRLTASSTVCVDCSESIENCSECNIMGSVCTLCEANFDLDMIANTSCLLRCEVDYCQTCVDGEMHVCQTCNTNKFRLNSGICQCLASDNRQVNVDAGTCIPKYGFYDNGGHPYTAVPCVGNCASCTSASFCLTCVDEPAFYVQSGNCISCSDITPQCQTCTSTPTLTCLTCETNYSLVFDTSSSTTECELDCFVEYCLECQAPLSLYCSDCELGMDLDDGQCVSQCGDARLAPQTEKCDDGNQNDGDGCSSTCRIQEHYDCTKVILQNSTCILNTPIILELISTQKIELENKIKMEFDFSPINVPIWSQIQLKDMLSIVEPENSITSYKFTLSEEGILTLELEYNDHIHDKPLKILVDPDNTNHPNLLNLASSIFENKIVPDGNEAAYAYSEDVYSQSVLMQKLATGIGILAFIVFFLGFYKGKMIGVETLALTQTAFIGLVALNSMNPCFKAISWLWPCTGYNIIHATSYFSDQYTVKEVKGIYLSSLFLENFNLTAVLIFLPVLLSAIAWIVRKFYEKRLQSMKKTNQAMQLNELKVPAMEKTTCATPKVSDKVNIMEDQLSEEQEEQMRVNRKIYYLKYLHQRLLAEYAYAGLMSSAYLIFTALGLEVLFGIKSMGETIGMLSMIFGVVFLLGFIGYFIFFLRKKNHFGEFFKQFILSYKITKYFYLVLMVERLILGVVWGALAGTFSYLPAIPMAFYLILMLMMIVLKPYSKLYLTYRAIVNMAICVVIQGIYLLHNIMGSEAMNTSQIGFILPIVVLVLVLVAVVYNLAALVYFVIQRVIYLNTPPPDFQVEGEEKVELSSEAKRLMEEMKDTTPVMKRMIASHQWSYLGVGLDRMEKMKVEKLTNNKQIMDIYDQI